MTNIISLNTNNQNNMTNLEFSSGCAPTTTGWETLSPVSDLDHSVERTCYSSHCVDYLTHNWSDDDLARSWRTVSRHGKVSVNCSRLENASWRIWNQRRNNIPTLNPAEINWHKDNDTTWLYGPLLQNTKSNGSSATVSKSSSFVNSVSNLGLKPALKKRSSFQYKRQNSDSSLTTSSKKVNKLRFNNQVEQFMTVNSPSARSHTSSRTSSVVQVASTTIKYTSSRSPHYFDEDEDDEFAPYSNLYHHSTDSELPPHLSQPSLPLVQSCYDAVATTVGIVTWARGLLF